MMKFLLAALAFAGAMAMPAKAQGLQPSSFEGNDWWLVEPGGEQVLTLLSNGAPQRHGSSATLWLIGLFPAPRAGGEIGVALSVIVNCDTKDGSMMEPLLLDANGDFKAHMTIADRLGPLPTTSVIYRFACTEDREGMRHFANRSRLSVIAEVRAAKSGH